MSKQNKTIKFLYEASKLLSNNELFTSIRSHMLSKCKDINSSKSLSVELVPRCDACGIVFKDKPPVNIINTLKMPSCYKKIQNGVNNTKYQFLSAKKFFKYKNNKQILITQCKLCKNQNKITINKIGHTRNPTNRVEISKKQKKLKKRKKNREFSGLDKSAVLSAKRSLEIEDNNNSSSKRLKTDTNVVNLVTPNGKKTPSNKFSKPESISLLTPKSIEKNEDSDIICLDSPKVQREFKNLNDMFTPIFPQNKTVIEISDSDVQSVQSSNSKKKKKKNKKKKNEYIPIIEHTPKIKNNNNVVLVAEQSAADKKMKKLNNLSNFLKNTSNIQKPPQNNPLQSFLSNFI